MIYIKTTELEVRERVEQMVGGVLCGGRERGIPQVQGEYGESASAEVYTLEDGTLLKLSEKDQQWECLG